ncbi:hypothetical protein VPHD85_0059 [Vibrio phage D85]
MKERLEQIRAKRWGSNQEEISKTFLKNYGSKKK